jgi:NAD(P)-dependent dehydrogenase (short-subunit alcohol dehydrogenase family)
MAINGFDPEKSIPDLHGKVALITGGKLLMTQFLRIVLTNTLGNQGIGQQTVLALAKHQPGHIYFTARSTQKAEVTLSQLKSDSPSTPVTVVECDLTSLESVKSAAKDFLSKSPRLDILILNAGIMSVPPAQTKDGYEIQMGTNHVGHALLTKLLLPTLEANAKKNDTRIIVLSSQGSMMARGIGYSALKTDGKSRTMLGGTQLLYLESKLANVYFAQQLAAHYPNITSVSLHPGIVATGLVSSQSLFQKSVIKLSTRFSGQAGGMFTPEEGAYNTLWAATVDKAELKSGEYYEPVGVLGKKTKFAMDGKASTELWNWTEEELKDWTL